MNREQMIAALERIRKLELVRHMTRPELLAVITTALDLPAGTQFSRSQLEMIRDWKR